MARSTKSNNRNKVCSVYLVEAPADSGGQRASDMLHFVLFCISTINSHGGKQREYPHSQSHSLLCTLTRTHKVHMLQLGAICCSVLVCCFFPTLFRSGLLVSSSSSRGNLSCCHNPSQNVISTPTTRLPCAAHPCNMEEISPQITSRAGTSGTMQEFEKKMCCCHLPHYSIV